MLTDFNKIYDGIGFFLKYQTFTERSVFPPRKIDFDLSFMRSGNDMDKIKCVKEFLMKHYYQHLLPQFYACIY